MAVGVIGASKGIGRLLFESLEAKNIEVTGISRNKKDIVASKRSKYFEMDAHHSLELKKVLEAHETVVHCSQPFILTKFLRCQPNIERLIVVGSTRLFSKFEDQKAKDLRLLAEKIWQSKINATVIHPTLTYGAPDSNNVERVVKFCSLSPIVPVPKGGNTLIQPVSASDLLQGLLTCLKDEETIGRTIIAAGGRAMSYKRFIEACAESSGKKTKVMLIPLPLIKILAAFSRLTPGIPSIHASELERLFENKHFSNDEFRKLLGREPLTFPETLESGDPSLQKPS
ncbi:MAG: hypothetical protein CMQ27_08730 [Gammaproteobacteria bacterium]|nr:hypothetical protein [Gammaproteobacteria bacterium]